MSSGVGGTDIQLIAPSSVTSFYSTGHLELRGGSCDSPMG